jgi:hypothetical protein
MLISRFDAGTGGNQKIREFETSPVGGPLYSSRAIGLCGHSAASATEVSDAFAIAARHVPKTAPSRSRLGSYGRGSEMNYTKLGSLPVLSPMLSW